MIIKVIVRKLGNSLVVVFPEKFIEKIDLRENEKLLINIVKNSNLSNQEDFI